MRLEKSMQFQDNEIIKGQLINDKVEKTKMKRG